MDNKTDAPKNTKSAARRALETKAQSAVDVFVAEHLRNSPFSQDTTAWNHFQAGIPVLIGAIADAMEG